MGPSQSFCTSHACLDIIVASIHKRDNQFQHVVDSLLPSFYIESALLKYELEEVQVTWSKAIIGLADNVSFSRRKNNSRIAARDWFKSLFWVGITELDPSSLPMYQRCSLPDLIIEMISYYLHFKDEPQSLDKYYSKIARANYGHGIRSKDYGTICKAFFQTLSRVLGNDYTKNANSGWIKVLSHIIKLMLPVAVKCELENDTTQSSENICSIRSTGSSESTQVRSEFSSRSNSSGKMKQKPNTSLRSSGTSTIYIEDEIDMSCKEAKVDEFFSNGFDKVPFRVPRSPYE